MAQILTAVAPDAEDRVRRILSGHDLHFVRDLDKAKTALASEAIKLIFVGARFDESRMFDLLDYIRKDVEHRKIPIVAAIVASSILSAETVSGLAHTTKIFGASVFVNLNDFSDNDIENARIRLIVEAVLLPPHVVPAVAKKLLTKSTDEA